MRGRLVRSLLLPLAVMALPDARAAEKIDFVRDIQAIFKESCLECHGPKKQRGKLSLESLTAIRGAESGHSILPANAKGSTLIELLLTADEEERMPRKAPPLSREKIALLGAWIDQGATWPDSASVAVGPHWAYEKPVRR